MLNFQVCPLNDEQHFVIKINHKIEPGKIELIKFLWIKYQAQAKFQTENGIEIAPMLIFQNVDKETLEHIANIMDIEFKKHQDKPITLFEIINNLSDLFKKIRQKNLKRHYLNLLVELFFIWKNQTHQINLKIYYQENLKTAFAFKIKQQKIIIKTLNSIKNTIKFNKKELLNFLKTESEIFACELFANSQGVNLEELFALIEDRHQLNKTQEKISFIKKNALNFFDEIKIDLDKSKIKKFDKSKLKTTNIDFLAQNFVVNIKLEISFTSDEYQSPYEIIRGYINGSN